MLRRDEELQVFKTQIDLVAFAIAEYGFEVERGRHSRATAALVNRATSEKVRISKRGGEFVYANPHDEGDRGTIIQFVQRRGAGNLGAVRKLLRPFVGMSALPQAGLRGAAGAPPPLEEGGQDFEGVAKAFEAMSAVETGNRYLEERGIPAEVYMHPRFGGRIRVDGRRSLVFPHWERSGGLTGYEIKNRGFTGFAKGGSKRLWGSRIEEEDRELVICETAIDALSYAALFGVEGRRFVSTAGALNPQQPALIESAGRKLPEVAEVVLAVDADEGGDVIAESIRKLLARAEGPSPTVRRHSPEDRGQDWNDALQAQLGPSRLS